MQHLAHFVPVRIEFVFEGNPSCESEFSRWRKSDFVPKVSSAKLKKNMYPSKEKHLLRTKSFHHIVSLYNWLSFERYYFLRLRWFKVGIDSACSLHVPSAE
jgi:hypothetical protein